MYGEVIQRLRSVSDTAWWETLFQSDPMQRRVSGARRTELICRAVHTGQTAAEEILRSYGELSLEQLYREMGMRVARETGGVDELQIVFAAFAAPDRVILYQEPLEELERFKKENGLGGLLEDVDAERLLLGHELFHGYERLHPELFTQQFRFESHRLGPIRITSKLVAISEIAAMAFSQRVNHARCNPCILNVLLLLPLSREKALQLLSRAEQAKAP